MANNCLFARLSKPASPCGCVRRTWLGNSRVGFGITANPADDALAAKFPNYSHHYSDSIHSTATSYPFEYPIYAARMHVKWVLWTAMSPSPLVSWKKSNRQSTNYKRSFKLLVQEQDKSITHLIQPALSSLEKMWIFESNHEPFHSARFWHVLNLQCEEVSDSLND